jgi:hypothetical protein
MNTMKHCSEAQARGVKMGRLDAAGSVLLAAPPALGAALTVAVGAAFHPDGPVP